MKKNHIVIAFLISVIFAVLYSITKIQYYPRELILKSKQFIQLLYENDLQTAYQLTSKRGSLRLRSPQLFKEAIERDVRRFIKAKRIKINYESSYPYQSYGNRIRRFFTGREIEEKQKNLHFHIYIDSEKDDRPSIGFEVRWELQTDKSWKITYFQSIKAEHNKQFKNGRLSAAL